MQKNYSPKSILSVISCAALLVLAVTLITESTIHKNLMIQWLANGSYYILMAIFGVWVWVSAGAMYDNLDKIRNVLVKCRGGILFSLVLTIAIFVSVKPGMRIFCDQAYIVGVSRSMIFDKTVNVANEGCLIYSKFNATQLSYEGRPYLMAFLMHIVHVLLGYRVENFIVVCFVVLFAIFSMIFILFDKWLGKKTAYIAVLLVAAQPVITQTATAPGLEMLQIFMIFAVLAAAAWYAEKPSAGSLLFLWAQCLMLVNTRYESIAIAGIVGTAILFSGRLRLQDLRSRAVFYCATPIFLLPLYWQRMLTWHFTIYNGSKGSNPMFTGGNFLNQGALFLKNAFLPYSPLPYAGLVNIAGIIGLVWLLVSFFLGKTSVRASLRVTFFAGAAVIFFLLVLVLSFATGDLREPNQSRYFAIFMMVLSMAAAYLSSRLRYRGKVCPALLLAIAAFLVYHPLSVGGRFMNRQYMLKEYEIAMSFIRSQPDKNFLIIYDSPLIFTAHELGAISFGQANRNPESTVLDWKKQRLYREIYVFQRIYYSTGGPGDDCKLKPIYHLETLQEIKHFDGGFLRISRVVMTPPQKNAAYAASVSDDKQAN